MVILIIFIVIYLSALHYFSQILNSMHSSLFCETNRAGNMNMPENLFDRKYYQKTPEFRNLLRIIGTSIEGHRRLEFGLSKIRGIGRRLATAIIRVSGLDPNIRIGLLTEEQQEKLVEIIRDPVKYGIPKWMVNRQKICAQASIVI